MKRIEVATEGKKGDKQDTLTETLLQAKTDKEVWEKLH